MKTKLLLILLMGFTFGLISCEPESPEAENEEEVITDVTLTFTPVNEGSVVTAVASDPDGDGPLEIEIESDAILQSNTAYTLAITFYNGIAQEDITEEVDKEGDEHMIFFEFTSDLFSNPTGNGNVDNRSDAVNYEDADVNGQPVGLSTTWTTGAAKSGVLRVILKHQPSLKSATSTANDGESDVDITFPVTIN